MTAKESAAPMEENLASRLRTMAQGRESLDVAQFQFIDLEKISHAYGDRWPDQKARIQNIAEGFLRRRMASSDLLINAGGGFLVVFGEAGGAEAEVSAGRLSHGLNEFFLGEVDDTPAPRFGATTLSMPVQELEKSLGNAPFVAPEHGAEPTDSFGLSQIEWRYQPIWDVKRETLSNWYVSPYLKKTGARLPGYLFESVSASASQFAAVDEASLWVSEQGLQELSQQGKQALIGVSIHACTLTNLATRARILSAIDRLDRQFFRYRVLKIAGVAPGFPRLYLTEIVSLLKSRVPNVVIGAAWDEPDIAGLVRSSPVAVGVSIPPSILGPSATVPVQTLLAKLSSEIQAAHAARMRFFVEGPIMSELAMKLAGVGVDNISSPRIWPARGAPDAMLKWPAARLAA